MIYNLILYLNVLWWLPFVSYLYKLKYYVTNYCIIFDIKITMNKKLITLISLSPSPENSSLTLNVKFKILKMIFFVIFIFLTYVFFWSVKQITNYKNILKIKPCRLKGEKIQQLTQRQVYSSLLQPT